MDYETIPAEFRDKEWWDIIKTPSEMKDQYFGFELHADGLTIPNLNETNFEKSEQFENLVEQFEKLVEKPEKVIEEPENLVEKPGKVIEKLVEKPEKVIEKPEKLVGQPEKPKLDTGSSKVINDDKNFQIQLTCNPFKVEDLNVSTANRMVIIRGEHGSIQEGTGTVSRKFERCYVLPKNCDVSNIDTSIKDGVLTIRCAKSEVMPGNILNIRVD